MRSDRVHIERAPGAIVVTIGPLRDSRAWIGASMLAAVVLVAAIEAPSVFRSLAYANGGVEGWTVLLLFFVVFGPLCYNVGWAILGSTHVAVSGELVAITTAVAFLKWTKRYPRELVGGVDWVERPAGMLRGAHRAIAFRIGRERLVLRSQISIADAVRIAQALQDALDTFANMEKAEAYRTSARSQ